MVLYSDVASGAERSSSSSASHSLSVGLGNPTNSRKYSSNRRGEPRAVNFLQFDGLTNTQTKQEKFQQDIQTTRVIMDVFQMIHLLSD